MSLSHPPEINPDAIPDDTKDTIKATKDNAPDDDIGDDDYEDLADVKQPAATGVDANGVPLTPSPAAPPPAPPVPSIGGKKRGLPARKGFMEKLMNPGTITGGIIGLLAGLFMGGPIGAIIGLLLGGVGGTLLSGENPFEDKEQAPIGPDVTKIQVSKDGNTPTMELTMDSGEPGKKMYVRGKASADGKHFEITDSVIAAETPGQPIVRKKYNPPLSVDVDNEGYVDTTKIYEKIGQPVPPALTAALTGKPAPVTDKPLARPLTVSPAVPLGTPVTVNQEPTAYAVAGKDGKPMGVVVGEIKDGKFVVTQFGGMNPDKPNEALLPKDIPNLAFTLTEGKRDMTEVMTQIRQQKTAQVNVKIENYIAADQKIAMKNDIPSASPAENTSVQIDIEVGATKQKMKLIGVATKDGIQVNSIVGVDPTLTGLKTMNLVPPITLGQAQIGKGLGGALDTSAQFQEAMVKYSSVEGGKTVADAGNYKGLPKLQERSAWGLGA